LRPHSLNGRGLAPGDLIDFGRSAATRPITIEEASDINNREDSLSADLKAADWIGTGGGPVGNVLVTSTNDNCKLLAVKSNASWILLLEKYER